MSVGRSSAGLRDNGARRPTEREFAGHRAGTSGVCPRCGSLAPVRATGRPGKWCTQRCRRASYEERRAAVAGAIAIEVVEMVTTTEHELDKCVRRVQASAVAIRKVLTHPDQVAGGGLCATQNDTDGGLCGTPGACSWGQPSRLRSFPPHGYVDPGW